MRFRVLLLLIIGLLYVGLDISDAKVSDSASEIGLKDTTQYGNLDVQKLLNWRFSYNSPNEIRDGINLSNSIPIDIRDFREVTESKRWKKYGWFEAELIADSTLAGVPFALTVINQAPTKIWMNGKLVLESGNPSKNPEQEKLSRWQNHNYVGITLREGSNFVLIEYSEHTLAMNLSIIDSYSQGIDIRFYPYSERMLRTYRGFVFGGVVMLLFLLILMHSYLGFKFREGYHVFVSLTTLFMLIHAFTTLSDTLIDWTNSYRIFYQISYFTGFVFVFYFYLLSIRSFYKLKIPWKTLTSIFVLIVALSCYSVYEKPEMMTAINAVMGISTFIYGAFSLYQAKQISKDNSTLSIAIGFLITVSGALLYAIVYWAFGVYSVTILILSTLMAYTGVPVSLTFNVAQSYAGLITSLEQRVKDRTAELEASNQFKTRFFANISHEFRTPLTISEGLVDKAIAHSNEEKVVKKELSVAHRNLRRLHTMVDQIIDLTKSDENEINLNRKYYMADELVSISVESFRSMAEHNNLAYNFFPGASDVLVHVDQEKIEIMVNNLISNAIKFSPKGASITIRTFCANNTFNVTVKDTGRGIPLGEEELIFERFYRINQSESDYVEGMGVGLELSRMLARLHGGDLISVANQEKGAMFRLSLPVSEANIDHAPENPEPHILEGKEETSKVVIPAKKNGYQVLLVEDNADMSRYVSDILTELGEVHVAENGEKALELLVSVKPDIIVTDLMMPKMGGQQLIEQLTLHNEWKNIPVIVLTAKALEEEKLKLLRIGVVDYITKPFKPEQLLLKTKNLLSYYVKKITLSLDDKSKDVIIEEGFKERVAAFITGHITDTELSVERLALEFSQSRRSFYRTIQLETGMTPAQFVREVRLTVARTMATNSVNNGNRKLTLEELTQAVGYKSTSGFKNAYKQRFGEHPLG